MSLPGKEWRILEISHKFHACCHGLHAMLEALSEAELDPKQIRSIKIRTHPRWMSVCNIERPRTGLEAKFSYRQTCAMALLGHSTASIAAFTDEICEEAEIVALRDLIEVREDEKLTETQSEVTVSLAKGSLQRFRHDLLGAMDRDERAEKLRKKASALLGDARAEALWKASRGERLADLTDQLVMS